MAAKRVILCDTSILIAWLRGDEQMQQELDRIGFDRLSINAVVVAEVLVGANKRTIRKTREVLNRFNWYDIDVPTSRMFVQLVAGYPDRQPGLPDMFIAASAIMNNAELFTLNRADFAFIPGIKLYNPQYQHS
jgi:predicted nucleic acid-binding protein